MNDTTHPRKQDPWAPFVEGAMTREDERQKLLRYRSGFYTFVIVTSASYLFWLSGLVFDENAFTVTLGDLQQIAFWVAVVCVGIFSVLHRTVHREATTEARIRFTSNPGARRYLLIFLGSAFVFGTGMFFLIFHLMREEPRSVWLSLAWAAGCSALCTFLGSGNIIRRATKREIEEAAR